MKGLTDRQRAVLTLLSVRSCSAPRVAEATGETLRAVHQHFDALEKKGLATSLLRRSHYDAIERRVARITADGIIALAVQP